jgi:hypothetical protein
MVQGPNRMPYNLFVQVVENNTRQMFMDIIYL